MARLVIRKEREEKEGSEGCWRTPTTGKRRCVGGVLREWGGKRSKGKKGFWRKRNRFFCSGKGGEPDFGEQSFLLGMRNERLERAD